MGDEVWLNLLEDEVDEEGGERVGGLAGEDCSRVGGRNPVAARTGGRRPYFQQLCVPTEIYYRK